MKEFIYGKQPVTELLKSHSDQISFVCCTTNNTEIIKLCREKNVNYKIVDEINSVSDKVSQGVMAEIDEYHYYKFEDIVSRYKDKEDALIVLLDQIYDPHNFGAILRTCNAAGVDAVVILDRRQVQITGSVIKSSSGAAFYEKVTKVNNLTRAVNILKKSGFWIVGTSLDTKDSYDAIDYKRKICIVVGNEGKGISRLVAENCDYLVKIPMKGKIESLNVSVATAILLYEVNRKRN